MTDVTTHGSVIRPDRMELITTSDRVPERLRRLENANSAGLSGGGGSLEVWIGPDAPSPRGSYTVWVDSNAAPKVVNYWDGSAWTTILPGAQGPAGPQGPPGPQGIQGIQGAVEVYEQTNDPGAVGEGSVWIDTDAVPVVSETIRTMRTGQSYVVGGALTAGMVIPPFFVPVMGVGQTTKVIGARHKIASGTSIVAQLTRNGANIGSAITVAVAKATASFTPVTIADGDEIGIVLSSPVGTPMSLSLTVIFEHTV